MLNLEAYLILESSILRQTRGKAGVWIKQVIENVAEYSDPMRLSINIASVPKQICNDNCLILYEDDVDRAHSVCRGWQPEKWSLVEAIRILFNLVVIRKMDNMEYILSQAYQLPELNEQVAFLKGLPLYGKTEFFLNHAREAIRSNIRSLFAAVALFNPFPADNFSENEWNNMILKAISWNYPLRDIYNVAVRDNAALVVMLHEYAQEQIGAKRPVSKDLWKYVNSHLDEGKLSELMAYSNSISAKE